MILSLLVFMISFIISEYILLKFKFEYIKNKISLLNKYSYICLKYIMPCIVVYFISINISKFVDINNSISYIIISRIIYGFFARLIFILFDRSRKSYF